MYQKIIIIGNLGGDPEMRYLPSGKAVTTFSVATSRKWSGADGKAQEETTWFRVKVWDKQAEVANQYLSKGKKVLVEGTLTPDPQTGRPAIFTRRDGTSGASFELRAETVRFLSGREDVAQAVADSGGAVEADDIPF